MVIGRLVPLERGDLVRGAVEQLRAFILARDGGSELPSEAELGERLGVSRTVLREALKHLQAQGLVALSQGKRARVGSADPQAAIESLNVLLRRSEGSLLHLVEVRRPPRGRDRGSGRQTGGPRRPGRGGSRDRRADGRAHAPRPGRC